MVAYATLNNTITNIYKECTLGVMYRGEFQQFGIYMVSIFKGYSQPKSGKTVLQNDINKLVGSGGGT